MTIRRHPLTPSVAAPGLKPDLELADRLAASSARCGPLTGRLAERFYERLFARVPQIRGMFPEFVPFAGWPWLEEDGGRHTHGDRQ